MNIDLDRLEKLHQKAAKGELRQEGSLLELHANGDVFTLFYTYMARARDAEYAAAAWNTLPALIQRMRKAEKIIDAAYDVVADYEESLVNYPQVLALAKAIAEWEG